MRSGGQFAIAIRRISLTPMMTNQPNGIAAILGLYSSALIGYKEAIQSSLVTTVGLTLSYLSLEPVQASYNLTAPIRLLFLI